MVSLKQYNTQSRISLEILKQCYTHFKRLQIGVQYLVFHKKRLEARVYPWQQLSGHYSVSFVKYISFAKFDEHCSNISGDILDSVFYYLSGAIYDVSLSSFA